ncbi:sarcosine oxidase subunit alpha family protein [Methylorubrum extorquens]|jgi:heterotetrameric sarcosine oxidase alpha subunit|uniref:Sarcosine oxidase alpha subunit n=3 Tax=Methylorubrum extorquens TaxID=408 RepID=C5B058_METEA|nr:MULTISPECIES: sarcosine oxidase subunit alpha family protein [Methylorubrum]ACS39408.1 putative Sarcosine oxidase alpha subunit [Methylorubrum extorquens AM1]MCP1542486.1 sarcosine oxidase subunit alpha [Methylorubrum extorquens]MCP1590169.1 sarcosine oxidase subunit alpha [Methylorubrum extorquens]BDL38995.1 sarcosine oxidase subunit alpha [Methylorubrum sp. GM97]
MTTLALQRAEALASVTSADQPFRTATGGLIDRNRPRDFSFDGRRLTGCHGDTLASALLANGVRLVGRSFKYHRPRGILSAGSEEPNALVELRSGARREPNTRATMAELYEGLEATSQNRWPSLAVDALSVNALLSPVFAAGFYYKTFMWPASLWEKLYEPVIRRAAGLGRAADAPDPDTYDHAHAHCDVLVIGGGPAGLSAALAAGRSGARVILVDEDFATGGRLLAERREIGGASGVAWAARAVAELESLPEVRILSRTTLFGVYDHGAYGAVERVSDHLAVPPPHTPRQRLWRIVARRAVLAAGAIERPHVFGGNDRPGVMLAGAVRTYLNRYGVLPGRRLAVFTSSDDGWRTAADILAAGGGLAAVIDTRTAVPPHLRRMAEAAGARVVAGGYVAGTKGHLGLSAIQVLDGDNSTETISCDGLAMANGWNPVVHLDSHLSRRPVWDAAIHAFVPGTLPSGMQAAGAAAGRFTLAECLETGARAGAEAASDCGFTASAEAAPPTDPESVDHTPLWRAPKPRGKAFVDFQNDVAASDVEVAHREGFRAVELLKRYTTLGMATDQGKTSNLAGLSIMAELTGKDIPSVGTTVFRPPFTPVAIGAFAGHHRGKEFRATRHVPSHAWAEENGAVFVETGLWLRPAYFPKGGETDWLDTVVREVETVRARVGICDVTTLGKIDIQGRDALAFIERVCANPFATLPVGKARYAVLLREDGFILDDGTIARMGETHYVMTASTANAARVMQHLEFCRQWLWPELDVQLASVSEQWAQYAVAGPRARDTLRRIVDPGFDLSNDAFPFLACADVTVGGGIPARLFRISFSGELAYELAVPAAYGDAAWRAVMQAGLPYGITAYGSEALSVMRIEKGHAAGAEINGQTTARDLGLGGMLAQKKDYIGRLMKERPALVDPDRPILVGFRPVDPSARLRAGAHFLGLDAEPSLEADEGVMTSVAYSPSLKSWIGIGLIRRGPERHGERVRAYDPVRGAEIEVEICSPVFVDPKEEKLRV